jgi:hypothetical protein
MPKKVIYQEMESRPDLEFDHILTEKLGWRSVAEMRRGMSAGEWARWSIYYQRKAQRQEMELIKAKGG